MSRTTSSNVEHRAPSRHQTARRTACTTMDDHGRRQLSVSEDAWLSLLSFALPHRSVSPLSGVMFKTLARFPSPRYACATRGTGQHSVIDSCLSCLSLTLDARPRLNQQQAKWLSPSHKDKRHETVVVGQGASISSVCLADHSLCFPQASL